MSDNLKWMNRHAVLLREPQWAGIAAREGYKIRADLRPLFDAHPDSLELLDAMAARGLYREGCEFIARMTHRRAAVWWGYCCLLSYLDECKAVASGAVKPAPDAAVELLEGLPVPKGIKLPSAPTGSLKDIDSFCKAPEVDLKAMLADYVPPPQDKSAILAASSAVKAKIDAIDRLIPARAREAFETARARRIGQFEARMGATPKANFDAANAFARSAFVNYKVNRTDSKNMKPILSLPETLEAQRKGIIGQIKDAFPEKYPKTPEAKLLLSAKTKKDSDEAIQSVWRWIVSPDERNTTLAMAAGNGAPGTPEGLLAYTAAWSFGDLAPEGKVTVPVPPELPGTGLNSVLLMLALGQEGHRKMKERYELYFKMGMDVVFGKSLWTEAVSEKLSPHAKLEAKWAEEQKKG